MHHLFSRLGTITRFPLASRLTRGLHLTLVSTANEIKKAYRQLSRLTHPDRNPDDPEAAAKFMVIRKAYVVDSSAIAQHTSAISIHIRGGRTRLCAAHLCHYCQAYAVDSVASALHTCAIIARHTWKTSSLFVHHSAPAPLLSYKSRLRSNSFVLCGIYAITLYLLLRAVLLFLCVSCVLQAPALLIDTRP